MFVAALIAAAVLVMDAGGGFRLLDNALHDLRVRTLSQQASGDLVIVEIDATSVRRLGAWPWPRGHHAMVLQRVLDADAAAVGFDISFSSPSSSDQDRRLIDAAAAAEGRLILPIFRQLQEDRDGAHVMLIDRPLPALERVARLASINVQPDADGIVRSLHPMDRIGDLTVPAMSTALLAPHGARTPAGRFVLDFGIEVESIPRLSFADVLLGQFDPAQVAGKSVLIGATAVELGDIVTVPRWGNLPGPLVIATGFESMRLDRALMPVGDPWFVLALCFAAALAPMVARADGVVGAMASAVLQLSGMIALSEALYAWWAIQWNVAPVMTALVISFGIKTGQVLRLQARRIVEHSREARRRIALLRSVVDTSIDAVIIADRDGMIRIANPACLPVFGREPEALVGAPADMLIDPDDPIVAPLRAMTAAGAPLPPLTYPVDVAGRHRDGRRLELDLALARVGAGDGPDAGLLDEQYTIYVFRDVSEQRRIEAMRRETLEAQVEAERSKADFLATASHELRTPLNHIKGFAALLAAGIGGQLSDKQREYVEHIDSASEHLTGVVTDILATAQAAHQGEGQRGLVPVANIVEGARKQVAALAAQRQVALEVGAPLPQWMLQADRESLERGVMHVLRNAVEFTPPAGSVVLACTAAGKDRVRIEIRDHGPGMSAQELERVSKPFGQLESALSRSHGGLGIGLSVARTSIEGHGGTLTLMSEKGVGTTARIELPLAPAAEGRAAA